MDLKAAMAHTRREDPAAVAALREQNPRAAETARYLHDYAPAPWPGDRLQPDEVTWFRLDIGRNRNADPKWLIPLICRGGGIVIPNGSTTLRENDVLVMNETGNA